MHIYIYLCLVNSETQNFVGGNFYLKNAVNESTCGSTCSSLFRVNTISPFFFPLHRPSFQCDNARNLCICRQNSIHTLSTYDRNWDVGLCLPVHTPA